MSGSDLESWPRFRLLRGATPLHPLSSLDNSPGGTRVFVKRDDLSGIGVGGNKVRKLEFLLGDAIAKGCNRIVTGGGLQSNSATLAAICARMAGMECDLALVEYPEQSSPAHLRGGNRLLQTVSGARTHVYPIGSPGDAAIEDLARRVGQTGSAPYVLPFGCSSPIGALGYVNFIAELRDQVTSLGLRNVILVHASGSGGSQAGLLAGISAFGLDWKVLGVSVVRDARSLADIVRTLAIQTLGLLGVHDCEPEVWTDDTALGAAYGAATDEGHSAMRALLRDEGIVLDPVYTGKAAGRLLRALRFQEFPDDVSIIFLHTGGVGGLFAYQDLINPESTTPTARRILRTRSANEQASQTP